MRGKFITIYGINNIGKSTHARLLVERLRREGKAAEYVKYPIYDAEPTGPFLNNVLRGGSQKISEDELQMWFVLNRYQFEPQLKKWLEDGVIVVAEDYVGTGLAWGAAKGLSRDWLKEMNRFLLREDLAILMEGQRDLRAVEAEHVHETNEELIARCQRELEHLADEYGWKRVQVREKMEDTAEGIWNAL